MNRKGFVWVLVLLVAALALVACGGGANNDAAGTGGQVEGTPIVDAPPLGTVPGATPSGGAPEAVGPTVDVAAQLGAGGFQVEEGETLSDSPFDASGRVIRVNGADVQIYKFDTPEDAAVAVQTVSPDGSSIGTSMVSWIATPHLYYSGDTIATYAGDDPEIIGALEGLFGQQFAGG